MRYQPHKKRNRNQNFFDRNQKNMTKPSSVFSGNPLNLNSVSKNQNKETLLLASDSLTGIISIFVYLKTNEKLLLFFLIRNQTLQLSQPLSSDQLIFLSVRILSRLFLGRIRPRYDFYVISREVLLFDTGIQDTHENQAKSQS